MSDLAPPNPKQPPFSLAQLNEIDRALKAYRALVLDGKAEADVNALADLINAVRDRIPNPPPAS